MPDTPLSEQIQRISKRVDQWYSSLALFTEQSALEPSLEWSRLWLSWRTASELHEELSLVTLKTQERLSADVQRRETRWWQPPQSADSGALSARWTGGYVWDASALDEHIGSEANTEDRGGQGQEGSGGGTQRGSGAGAVGPEQTSEMTEERRELESERAKLSEVTAQLCLGEQQLRDLFLALPSDAIDKVKVRTRLDQISEALRENNKNTQLSDLEEARRALRWVHESRLLKRLVAHAEGSPGTFQEDLVNEVFSLGEVDWYLDALSISQTQGQFQQTYHDGLEREVSVFEQRVAQSVERLEAIDERERLGPQGLDGSDEGDQGRDGAQGEENSGKGKKKGKGKGKGKGKRNTRSNQRLSTLKLKAQKDAEALAEELYRERSELIKSMWRCLLRGGELLVTIYVSPTHDTTSLIERCAGTRDSLRASIEQLTATLTPAQFSELFSELSWELFYYSSDMMSEVDQTSLNCSVFRLQNLQNDLEWYLAWTQVKQVDDEEHVDLALALKRLEKQYYHVRVELQDKKLEARLNSIFGARAVKAFEQLVFSLIWVVLGLLFYEFLWVEEGDHDTRKTLALIDTAICVIFLLEFTVKLGLSQAKWFYFKRRWFIDLLPSIPFVYFTDYLFLETWSSGNTSFLAQLSRLARPLRVMRPVIRMVRLISFSLRGVDRLVRRHSQWLDHNLVFFEPSQSLSGRETVDELTHANQTYAESLSLTQQLTAQLDPHELACLLPHYMKTLSAQLRGTQYRALSTLEMSPPSSRSRELPVEHAIDNLVHLQGAELEAILGYRFPKRLHTLVGLFDLPILNRLPLIQWVFIKRRNSTASEFAAWWVRGFGKLLEFLMSIGYWFADLYGVVTGPKLIDRVGSTLVTSFERPAKRLLIFGGLLLTLQLGVSWLGISALSKAVSAMQRFVGVPMIVIGSICFVPLFLGRWMKRIADQASEFYRFTSEAQFINLLKHLKEQQMSDDLETLYLRVIGPEERLYNLWETQEEFDARRAVYVAAEVERVRAPCVSFERREIENETCQSAFCGLGESQSGALTPDSDLYWLDLNIHYLYRDYLDGALLHHTDIKTTEQLLGNLSLRNLFDYKINLTVPERRALERLDLGSHRSIIGPYMWFSLITQSVSQGAAQLVIDYNRYVIPIWSRARSAPETLELFEQWLRHKKHGDVNFVELEERKSEQALFNSTDISVLQILAERSSYEDEVRARFGDEVLELLIRDQKRLIRGVFSSYPLYRLPKPIRTLNPYLLYNDFIQGGRVFWLPFRIIGLAFKGVGLVLRWTKVKIDEIRFPDKVKTEVIPQKDFLVAQRKIDRMRKPIFMKLLTLRAQIDFAYLGLTLDDLSALELTSEGGDQDEALVHQDLDAINALEVERVPIDDLISSTQTSLRDFYQYLEQRGLTGERLAAWVLEHYPELHDRQLELSRAFMTAFLCDFKDLQSYLQTREQLQELVQSGLTGKVANLRLHTKLLGSAARAASRVVHRGQDEEQKGFKLFWDHFDVAHDLSAIDAQVAFKRCWGLYLSEGRDLQPLLTHFAERGLPDEDVIFHEVARTLPMWTQELVSLRAIQTLALMDVNNYRSYIKSVGSYDEDER